MTTTPGLRAPRMAEMVADALRERILSGRAGASGTLPRQADLMAEFGVSQPSMREALRILETEGLITVRRGNVGGAEVHAPAADAAAYMLGLVLEARAVDRSDVGAALRHLVPAAAASCAELEVRDAVVGRLRALHEAARDAVDDPDAFPAHVQAFVAELAEGSPAVSLSVVLDALMSLWAAGAPGTASVVGGLLSRRDRRSALRLQGRLVASIERGDPEAAHRLALRHHDSLRLHVGADVDRTVRARTVREGRAA